MIADGGPDVEEIRTKKRLHELRANKFFELLKRSGENRNTLCVAFDLQQNMPLPRSNVGEAYYKRQLWLYNFGILIHRVKKKKEKVQSPKNVFFTRGLKARVAAVATKFVPLWPIFWLGYVKGVSEWVIESCIYTVTLTRGKIKTALVMAI